MKRTIDITVGVLLFASGALAAWECYAFLLTPFFRGFIIHPSWFWFVAVLGTVAALCAVCLLRWRRPGGLIGTIAEFILGVLLLQVDYTDAAVVFLIGGLVWWRFVWTTHAPVIHAEV